jgi:cell division topological specificity factor MinE
VGIWSKFIGQLQSSPKIQYTEVSASAAKERLKVALTYDRNGLEQGAIESLREELVRLMAEHLDVQTEDVEVNIDESTGPNRLVASIALRPPRRPRPTVAAATEAR